MVKSKVIFVNASSTLLSGGMIVATDIIEELLEKSNYKMIVCAPDTQRYSRFQQKCAFLPVPKLILSPFFRWVLDSFWLPYAIRTLQPDIVFSITNLPAKTKFKQLFYHDNAFITNDSSKINLSGKTKIKHRLRRSLFIRRCNYVTSFIAQTELEKKKLSAILPEQKEIHVISPLVPLHLKKSEKKEKPVNPFKKIFYPARYYPHKNIEFILEISKCIEPSIAELKFYITIDPSQGAGAKKLLKGIEKFNTIFNLGELSPEQVANTMQEMDAVILPSKLETFGLNSIEAWYFNKPLLAADLPYAQSTYGDSAIYLDTDNPQKSFNEIVRVVNNNSEVNKLVNAGRMKLAGLSTIDEIIKLIDTLTLA